MAEVNDEAEIACAVCTTDMNPDDTYTTVDDQKVCSDCMIVCERCSDILTVDDDTREVDDCAIWCMSCIERAASYCDSCEEYNSWGTSYVGDRGESWCESCTNSAYWCDGCDRYYADGCDNGCNDDNDTVIHDYSYRPDPIFHSTNKNERLFFGIEIEMETRNNLVDASNYAHRLEDFELAYLKHDGSLNHGFELVTHPMSHDYYKNEAKDLWETLEHLRSGFKVKSWDTSTCGLHIHISRTGFNGGAHMHRFLNLVYSNQEFYETLAGRSSDQWAKFTDVVEQNYARDENGERIIDTNVNGYKEYRVTNIRSFKRKLDTNRGSDRYSAVNTLNRNTLEMRIFRGTVNSDTVKAQLDLAHASVEYTRTMTVKDIREGGALTSTQFIRYIAENAGLYPELFARVSKLILPVSASRQTESV